MQVMELDDGNSLGAQNFALVKRWLIAAGQGEKKKRVLAINMKAAASASRGFHI